MTDLAYSLSFWAKYACVDSAVWHTAIRLRLFEHLPGKSEGALPLPDLAQRIDASLRGTRVIVELLHSSGVLHINDRGELSILDELVNDLHDPEFVTQLAGAGQWWSPAKQLPIAVRTGKPVRIGDETWDLLGHFDTVFLADITSAHLSENAARIFDRAARHFLRTQVLIGASELGILTHLANHSTASMARLMEVSKASATGLQVLLDSLKQMGIVECDAIHYAYHPQVRELFHPKALTSYRQGLRITDMFWEALHHLDAAVRYDQRSLDLHDPEQSGPFYLALAQYNTSVFASYLKLIRNVPITLNQTGDLVNAEVLDVGAGSGVWGATFAYIEPTAHVTFMEQPQVLVQTRQNVAQLKLKNEMSFWADDLLLADYGEDKYDVIILGQICHTQHPDQLPGLFAKLARALRPGGHAVVADHVLNERRDAPIDYLYFAVKEFVATQGDILSLPEYIKLFNDAGFSSTQCYRLSGGLDVIVGRSSGYTLPASLISSPQQQANL